MINRNSAYYASHKEEIKARRAEYVVKNADAIRAKSRAYYWAHREERLKKNAEWRKRPGNTESVVAGNKRRYWEDAEKHRAARRLWNRKRMMIAKQATVDALGGKCAHCGFADIRALCIDHVNSDGKGDRWYGKMGYMEFLKKVRNDKTGRYQILCHNCNWIKRKGIDRESGGNRTGMVVGAAAISRDRRLKKIREQERLAA